MAGGKLLVSSIDLETDLDERPVARQMRHSLLAYMAGEEFDPRVEVSVGAVRSLARPLANMERMGATVTADSEMDGYPAAHVLDGNPATIWHTAWGNRERPFPHHLVIDLQEPRNVTGLAYLPRQDKVNGRIARFAVHLSGDGTSWGEPVAAATWPNTGELQWVRFGNPRQARYVKIVAEAEMNGNVWASAAEVEVLIRE